jgi:hypothetical protein
MTRNRKLLLGIATIWPFIYLVVFFIVFIGIFIYSVSMRSQSGANSSDLPGLGFMVFFALHLITMLWILALTIFYVINVFQNDRVDKDKKTLWAVVIFLGNIFAMPIYWYLYIWRELPQKTQSQGA